MATVTYIRESKQSISAMKGVIDYCCQDKKVYDEISNQRLVSGVNCDGENAFAEFLATKKSYKKTDGINFYQYVQSFSPEENITPHQAHEIAIEFAEKAWTGYEVLVATHCDVQHIHSHFVINSVSFENGNNLSARAVQPNFKHSKYRTDDRLSETDFRNRTRVYGNKLEELSDGAEESFRTDSERNQVSANADDEIYRTGWEESRAVFEQYLAKRSGTGISNCVTSEEVNFSDNLKMDSNNGAVLGGINSLAESLSRIIDDDSGDEEERRKRIEAEQNGSDIGTLLGLTAGLIAGAISKEENIEYEDEETGFNLNM